LSCRSFSADAVRLQLHALAYNRRGRYVTFQVAEVKAPKQMLREILSLHGRRRHQHTGEPSHPPAPQPTRRRNGILGAADRPTERNITGLRVKQQTGLAPDTVERLAVLASDGPSAVLALIERVALDPRADVEKLERMMAMYERLEAKEAELAYNAAKGRILKKLARIKIVKNRPVLYEIEKGKPQKGTYEAFKYAPLEEITNICAPSWRKRTWISPTPTNRGSAAAS